MATIRRREVGQRDAGQRRIDEYLSNLEDDLHAMYQEASDGIQKKLDTFLDRYVSIDEEMQSRVNADLMTQEQYDQWRQSQLLRTRQMEAQIESITNDLVQADVLASQMINGQLPEVYTSAYNFGIYTAEVQMELQGGYVNTSFSLYNADAIRIIQTEDPDLIPWTPLSPDEERDELWNRRHVQLAITQGILQGDSIRELSNRLLPVVNMDENASRRTARTAYTSIQNQARRDAIQRVRNAGIQMDEYWMSVLQDNSRDTHIQMHGTLPNEDGLYGEGIIPRGALLRFPADPRGAPEQVYNCQCSIQAFLHGIDHSHDDELYARFMEDNYPDDWVSVRSYRSEETRRNLERQRELNSGERPNREVQYANRRRR